MGFLRRILPVIISLMLLFGFSACVPSDDTVKDPSQCIEKPCDPDPPDPPDDPVTVEPGTIPEGALLYENIKVTAGGKAVPLHLVKVNNSNSWSPAPSKRADAPVGYLSKGEGETEIAIDFGRAVTESTVIRPLSEKLGYELSEDKQSLTFSISDTGVYIIEPDGKPASAVTIFVRALESGREEASGNVIRFPAGLHDRDNNPDIDQNGNVVLSSGTTVVLDEGAVVRAAFRASNVSNVRITGRGIIDGSQFDRDATPGVGTVKVPLDFSNCENIVLEDFSVHDAAGWCVNFFFNTNSTIDGVKIFTSRSNGDGISLQSCKDIVVKNCFLRTWDDALVVKNYPVNRGEINGATENILFENCGIWSDLAQCMEIGYETVGEKLEGVTFKDILVFHAFHKPVMSIHNANNARIKNIVFENITVEDARMGRGDAGWNDQLIDFRNIYNDNWSTNWSKTSLGEIDGVLVKNVNVIDGKNSINIAVMGAYDAREGYKSYHYVRNVTLENIYVKGEKITADHESITFGNFPDLVENFVIK